MDVPIAQQLADAINQANIKNLDELSHTIWKAFGISQITGIEADKLSVAIEARRSAYSVGDRGKPAKSSERRSRGCKSPDRARSIARRRAVAMSGAIPSPLACKFTMGELAACAGVCRTTARNALREAAALGLIIVEERRRSYTRSETNIVRIVSPEWRTWLRLGSGCKKPSTTNNQLHLFHQQKMWAHPHQGSHGPP